MNILETIQNFCKQTKTKPADLVMEWTPQAGCRLYARTKANRGCVVIKASMDYVAMVVYLCATGQEAKFPNIEKRHMVLQEKMNEAMRDLAYEDKEEQTNQDQPLIVADWRSLKSAKAIAAAFPKKPTADDLLDLYERNKQINSPELEAILKKPRN